MAGNICRCGAYANIVDAIAAVAPRADRREDLRVRARRPPSRAPSTASVATGRQVLRRRHQPARPDEGRRRGSPTALVDLRRLGLTTIAATETGGVLIDAGVTNSAIANHPLIRTQYPVLSQAILSAAPPRSCATWRPRAETCCSAPVVPYFMETAFAQCNKRDPGSGMRGHGRLQPRARHLRCQRCLRRDPPVRHGGRAGHPRRHRSRARTRRRARSVRSPSSSGCPATNPQRDNTLRPRELIVGIELPPSPFAEHSWYLKVRDRHSYAFALVSVAAGLHDRRRHDQVGRHRAGWRRRRCRGGCARPRTSLVGQPPDRGGVPTRPPVAMAGARPLSQNGFKVDLGRHSVVRALTLAAQVRTS